MEKVISICGQDARFKATGALPLRYKAQFGRDLFADMAALDALLPAGIDAEGEIDIDAVDLSKLETELFYNIVWAMAKCADPSIPPPIDWLDRFDAFPIWSVFNELQGMLIASMQTTKN